LELQRALFRAAKGLKGLLTADQLLGALKFCLGKKTDFEDSRVSWAGS